MDSQVVVAHKGDEHAARQHVSDDETRTVRRHGRLPVQKLGGGLEAVDDDDGLAGGVEMYDRA